MFGMHVFTFTFVWDFYVYFRIKQIKKDVNQLLLTREKKIKKNIASKKEQEKTRTKKLGHMKYPFNSMC